MRHKLLACFLFLYITHAHKPALAVSDEARDPWFGYLRGARRDHHLSLSMNQIQFAWQVGKLGSITDETFKSGGPEVRITYSFYLNLTESTSYFLGSSIGYLYDQGSDAKTFTVSKSYSFPGVLVGISYQPNSYFRLGTQGDYYMERHDNLQDRDRTYTTDCVYDKTKTCIGDPHIALTMMTFNMGVFFEWFFQLKSALRLEVHQSLSKHFPPTTSQDAKEKPIQADIAKQGMSYGAGLTFHIL